MLFLFIPFSLSVYIPLSLTVSSTIPTLSLSNLTAYSSVLGLLALAWSDSDSESGAIAPLFIDASVCFYSQAACGILDSAVARNLSRKYAFELVSSRVPGTSPPRRQQFDIFSSSLPRVLRNIPFALFAAPNYILQIDASTQMGIIQIVPVTSQVLMELEVDPPTLALFRQEDQAVVSINDDVEELYTASYAVFSATFCMKWDQSFEQ
jgi:hypothetical protein